MGHKDYCCVPGCVNRREDKSGLSFYSIPLKPHERFQSWMNAIGRGSDWIPTPHTRICSFHFVGGKKTNVPFHPAYTPTLALNLQKDSDSQTPAKKKRKREEEKSGVSNSITGPTAAWFEYYNAVMTAAQQQLVPGSMMMFQQQGVPVFPNGDSSPFHEQSDEEADDDALLMDGVVNDEEAVIMMKKDPMEVEKENVNPIGIQNSDENTEQMDDEASGKVLFNCTTKSGPNESIDGSMDPNEQIDTDTPQVSDMKSENKPDENMGSKLEPAPQETKSITSRRRKRSAPVRIIEDSETATLSEKSLYNSVAVNLTQEMVSSPQRRADLIASSPSSGDGGSDDNTATSENQDLNAENALLHLNGTMHKPTATRIRDMLSSKDTLNDHSNLIPSGKTVAQLLEEKRCRKSAEGMNDDSNHVTLSPRSRSPPAPASNHVTIVPPLISRAPALVPPSEPTISTIWQDTHHVTNMTKYIEKYWREGAYTDLIINVEGESLPAHKLVLASCSSYVTNLLASLPDAVLTIHLPGKKHAMKIILNFMYTGQLTLDSITVFDVLLSASLLMMDRVKLMCERFIELHQLRPATFLNGMKDQSHTREEKVKERTIHRPEAAGIDDKPCDYTTTNQKREVEQEEVEPMDGVDGEQSVEDDEVVPDDAANQDMSPEDIQSMLEKIQAGGSRSDDVGEFINKLLHVHDNVYDGSPSKQADFDDAALQNANKKKVNPFAYICSICQWRFPSETYCVKHILKRHPKVHPDRISQYVISGRVLNMGGNVEQVNEAQLAEEARPAPAHANQKPAPTEKPSDDESVSCGVCGTTFNNIEELTDHGNKYHKGGKEPVGDRFCCSLCNEKFTTHDECVEHIGSKHPDVYTAEDHVAPYFEEESGSSHHQVWTKFVCRGCQDKFPSHQLCREHCLQCPKTDARRLQRGDYIGYQCNHCDFYTPKKRYLPFHEHYKHGVALPSSISYIKCPVCGRKCMSNSDLAVHMSIHGEKVTMHRCEVCNSSFTHAAALRTHVRARHMKEFACELCPFRTKCARKFRAHLTAHNKKAQQASQAANRQSPVKSFSCPHCTFHGPSALSLRVHIGKVHNIISFETEESQLQRLSDAQQAGEQTQPENLSS